MLDLGFVRLTDSEAESAGTSGFVDLTPRVSHDLPWWRYRCLLLGYPARDQWRDFEKSEYHLSQTYYNGPELREGEYKKSRLNKRQQVAIDFNHRRIDGPNGRGGKPNFVGMSGGGIWEFDIHNEYTSSNRPRLVGIMAGKPPKNGKALFGASAN